MLKKSLIIVFLALLALTSAKAQVKGLSTIDPEDLFKTDMMDQMSSGLDELKSTPIGRPVKPEFYKVGPGDVLAIQNLSLSSNMKMSVVTPENSVLIPRVGEVSLEGLNLKDAKEKIVEAISDWNENAVSYVTLYKPRTVLVQISGNTNFNGSYSLPASYTVSMALNIATKPKMTATMPMIQSNAILYHEDRIKEANDLTAGSGLPNFMDYSSRNITVMHMDGRSTQADLLKAKALNSVEYDPYISDGDLIYVAYDQEDFDIVSISGEVVHPAVIPYKADDDANTLFRIGFGLTDKADIDNIYLVCGDNLRKKLELTSDMRGIANNQIIEPGCLIVVGKKEVKKRKTRGVVAISGEVENPGVYVIEEGKSRLLDVVNMAGGLTGDAYPPLGRIVRSNQPQPFTISPEKDYFINLQYSDLSYLDSIRYKIDISLRKNYVSCNMDAALKNGSEDDNVYLENGDLINIPSKPTEIYIYGQVLEPGFIPFVEGKPLEWYVERVGGYGSGADISRARIIRGKDRVWIEPDDGVYVLAGDEIYVPRYKELPPGTEIQQYAAIASITSTAVFMMVSLIQFFSN